MAIPGGEWEDTHIVAKRGRVVAWSVAGIAVVVIAAAIVAARDVILAEWLIRKLDSHDDAERIAAVVELGRLRSTRAVPKLVEIFREQIIGPTTWRGEERVSLVRDYREETKAALVSIGAPAAEALLGLMKDKNAYVHEVTRSALGEFGPEILPRLLKGVADPDSMVRRAILDALDVIGPTIGEKTARELIPLLQNREWRVREAALLGLSYAGSKAKEAVPALLQTLDDERLEVRLSALHALTEIGVTSEAIPSLVRRLERGGEEIEQVADALGAARTAGKDAVPALARALEQATGRARVAVVDAIGSIGPEANTATTALVRALTDWQSNGDRGAALKAIASIGPAALPALIASMNDVRTRAAATEALVQLAPHTKDAVATLVSVLRQDDKRSQAALGYAAQALGRLGKPAAQAVPELTSLVERKDGGDFLRARAVQALGRLGLDAQAAVPTIAKNLENAHAVLLKASALALGRIGEADPAVLAALEKVRGADGTEILVKACAALALLHLGSPDPGLRFELRAAFKDPVTGCEAVQALEGFRAEAALVVPELIELLRNERNDLVAEVAAVLRDLAPDTALPALKSAIAARGHEPESALISLAGPPEQDVSNADARRILEEAVRRIEESY